MKQRKQIEGRLSPREIELADFVENAVVGLHWVAEDGTILWANQAELDLLGYTLEEYIGHHIAEFHADQDIINDILQRLKSDQELSNYEATLRCKDGSIRQVLISSSVRFEDQQFIHTRCFTVDITERKRAEERMHLLYQLTTALAETLTLAQVATVIVEQVFTKIEASAGSVVILNKEKTRLKCLATFGYKQQVTETWQTFSLDSPVPLAQSVRTQKPVWLRNYEELQTRFPAISSLPEFPHTSWAAIPLIVEKRVVGALGLSFSTPQHFDEGDRDFLLTLAQPCAQALERARLSEVARDSAVLEERHRLARDLHDAVSQALFAATTIAQSIPALWKRNPKRGLEKLNQMVVLNQAAMAEMRTLLLELRPDAILQTSLPGLLMQLLEAARGRRHINVKLITEGEEITLDPEIHLTFYRVAQESIHNVLKHSGATHLRLFYRTSPNQALLRIEDDGTGFDLGQVSPGMGLGNMQERAKRVGASFVLDTTPDVGTVITLTWVKVNEL